MSFDSSNAVLVGSATKKDQYDKVFDNTLWCKEKFNVQHTNDGYRQNIVVARYTTSTTFAIADSSYVVFDYDTKVLDDPGTDRVTTGASWAFTADRAMVVKVTANATVNDGTPNFSAGEILQLFIYKDVGAGFVLYSRIGAFAFVANAPTGMAWGVGGSDIVSLASGDKIQIRVRQNSGAALGSGNTHTGNHVSIEEI